MKKVFVLVVTVALASLAAATAFAQGPYIYNDIPGTLPGNLFSQAFEAQSASEFGDRVVFTGVARQLTTVTVTMSSWGCQVGHWYSADCATTPGATFTHPITVNVYAVGVGNQPGALLATKTATVNIPYRPTADYVNCTGSSTGKWYSAADNLCYNGFAANVTVDMSSLAVTLPNSVIVGVAYNTSHYGYAPIGEATACYSSSGGCGYDSLNVAALDPAVTLTAGSNPAPNDAYLNSSWNGAYCDGGAGGLGTFRLDPGAGCWTGFKPALAIRAVNPPASAEACKKNGWQTLTNGSGAPFPNQGQCIQYFNTGK
jgi:hypothetical protein